MEIFNFNDRTLFRIVFPLVAILLILTYTFFRRFVLNFLELLKRLNTQKKVEQLRRSNERQKSGPIIARKTDLISQLSSQQKKHYQYAEQLLAQKKFLEAARIFESIQFQRRAIDILERSGYIAEAAAVLMRMKLPHRAAVLYERNGKFLKAAELFLLADKKDAAAKNFEKVAEQNYPYYKQAGDCYFQAGMLDHCLAAYSKLLLSDEILRICLAAQKFEFLYQYLMVPFNASYLLPRLKPEQFAEMLQALSLNPKLVQVLALWVSILPEPWLLTPCLRKSAADELTARLFWSLLSPKSCHKICHVFAKNPQLLRSTEYKLHGNAMIYQKKNEFGEYFLKLAPFGASSNHSEFSTFANDLAS